MHFQALVGEDAFDIEIDDDRLSVDGETISYTFSRLAEGKYAMLLDGRSVSLFIEPLPDGLLRITHRGRQAVVHVKDDRMLMLERFGLNRRGGKADREIRAPMPGLVLIVEVEVGQRIEQGDGLVVLEAMKMENELQASGAGTVAAIHVKTGEAVGKGDLLIEIDP